MHKLSHQAFYQLIHIKNITKAFGQKRVLNRISGTIKKGGLISLVGMTGSGKTTLLKIIAGLIPSDTGSIYLNSNRLQGPKDKLIAGHEEIKLVFQDFALKPNMSVEENLNYALLGYEDFYKKNESNDSSKFVIWNHLEHSIQENFPRTNHELLLHER